MNIKELKKYIKIHKIKYQVIADKSGIPIGTLRNLFSNSEIDPRYSTIEKIEKALGIDTGVSIAQTYYTSEERELIENYKSLSEKDKKVVSALLTFMKNERKV